MAFERRLGTSQNESAKCYEIEPVFGLIFLQKTSGLKLIFANFILLLNIGFCRVKIASRALLLSVKNGRIEV